MFICHSHEHTLKKGFTKAFRTWKITNLRRNTLYDSQALEEHGKTHRRYGSDGSELARQLNPVQQTLVALGMLAKIPYNRFENDAWAHHIRAVVQASKNRTTNDFMREYISMSRRKKLRQDVIHKSVRIQDVSMIFGYFQFFG